MPILHPEHHADHELGPARFTSIATPSRGATAISVWRVELPAGHPPTPHEVTREETFVVLSGSAAITLGDVSDVVPAGGAIVVPARTQFALSAHGDETLALLCCAPVGVEAQLPGGEAFAPPWTL